MSFKSLFKTFGKINLAIAKTVGKTAGNLVGSYVGVKGLGNMFDKNGPPTAGAPMSAAADGATPVDTQNKGGFSLQGILSGATTFINGLHPTVKVQGDVAGTIEETKKAMPPWLMPVGIGAAVLLVVSMMNKKK
jgi:hypothetical protein